MQELLSLKTSFIEKDALKILEIESFSDLFTLKISSRKRASKIKVNFSNKITNLKANYLICNAVTVL